MGTIGEFVGKLDLLSANMRTTTPRTSVEKGALAAKVAYTAALTSAVPSRRLRNVGKKGSNLSVSFNVTGVERPVALVHANGPWQIIENDTKAHTILPRSVGRAQGRSKAARHASKQQLYMALFGGTDAGAYTGTKPLSTPYGPRFRVNHPGTRGKHPWAKGSVAARIAVPAAMGTQALKEIRAAFGV